MEDKSKITLKLQIIINRHIKIVYIFKEFTIGNKVHNSYFNKK